MIQGVALTAGFHPSFVPADKGFDSGDCRQYPVRQGVMPVIPPGSNRKNLQDYDCHIYNGLSGSKNEMSTVPDIEKQRLQMEKRCRREI